MTEKKDDVSSEKINTVAVAKVSREPFFGTLLFGFMIFLVVVIIGAVSWGVYRGIEFNQKQTALPSISTLSQEAAPKEEVAPPEADVVVENHMTTDSSASQEADLKKAQVLVMKVLNGGASKGSAGTLVEFLKKNAFTQVTVGNTLTDYVGTTIYYAPSLEKEAGLARDVMLKTYPKTEIKPAIKSNLETSQAPLTIIVGK